MQETAFQVPSHESVIGHLRQAGMLPAIWFIFSRVQCDTAAILLHTSGLKLVSAVERTAIKLELGKLR